MRQQGHDGDVMRDVMRDRSAEYITSYLGQECSSMSQIDRKQVNGRRTSPRTRHVPQRMTCVGRAAPRLVQ